ncbi:MAG: class I SAM-dependent methyltransferase [Salinivirgaceae bacterium]|jgi:2-polyprenyl-3-methyl-5-hydroxy-6-metoxy-1,4-benzoquinol methylase|nr:class I SAM-dependent methyltransferase [Bacteroidales bacterium]
MKIIENLIAPDTKERLILDIDSGTIQNLNTDLFYGKIVDGIPIILPKTTKKSTDLHKQSNSEFDYVDHYTKDAEIFDYFQINDEISENERRRLNQIIINKITDDATMILDVGCGNGWLSKMIQNDKNNVVSLDISHRNVSRVLKEQPHPNHTGIVADVFNLPFPPESFDIIVASEIIEHVYDPKMFIDCLLDILKPSGKIIITTPYNEKIPLSLCVHCNQLTPGNAHLHSFNEKNIVQMISESVGKIKVFKSVNKHFLIFKVHWIMRCLPFSIWHTIDKIAVKLLGKPTRLIVEITK